MIVNESLAARSRYSPSVANLVNSTASSNLETIVNSTERTQI